MTAIERVFAWNPPSDWGRTTGSLDGIPNGMYALQLRFTTSADNTDPVATGLEIGTMRFSEEEVADNEDWNRGPGQGFHDPDSIGVVAFMETAAEGNMGSFTYRFVS
jgi:hypothetical protein